MPDDPRIAATLDHWKRELLDLGKRNRAIHFRPTRVSTITVVDEQPAEVFRRLYLLEKSMRFRPGAGKQEETLPEVFDAAVEEDEEPVPSPDFIPYDPTDLSGRHTDEFLQTALSPDRLDRSLRRIDEQARSTIEEQGVNVLFLALGMLHYRETREGRQEESFRAPLLLLPVTLSRKTAKSGYAVQAADEDPLVNPAIGEYLRRTYGISLPDLPDLAEITPDYDLQAFYKATTQAIAGMDGWSVKSEIHLGLFSFQKLVMYKDLEANGPGFAAHPQIRRLITRDGRSHVGLPDEVKDLDLDRAYAPEARFQVVDADSSQLRAIAAVDQGYDLVLEGPPGTGKSQTITNLIAQALGSGRSVLFVAEKLAALQVVHRRLVNAGLGELCLELHSAKANKRLVLQEIGSALNASLQRVAAQESSGRRLQEVRSELTDYVAAVHTPRGALGITPYEAYGRLGEVLDAPKLPFSARVQDVTPEALEDAVRDLERLAEAARPIGIPAVHPWRDTGRTFYPEDVLDRIREILEDLLPRLESAIRRAAEVEASLGLPPIRTFRDVETAAGIADVLGRSPGAPVQVLESEAWNAPPPAALQLVEEGRQLSRLTEQVESRFTPEAVDREHAGDIAYVERKQQSFLSWLSFLDGRYRMIRQRWIAWRRPGYQPTLARQAEDLKDVDALRRQRSALAARGEEARQLFGDLWRGETSSWAELESYIRWVVELRSLYVTHGLKRQALTVVSSPRPDLSSMAGLREIALSIPPRLADLRALVGWPADYLASAPLEESRERLRSLLEHLHLAPRWAAFEQTRVKTAAGIAGDLLPLALSGTVPFSDLPRAFLRAFYQRWLSDAVQDSEPLCFFDSLTHERRIDEFRRLDRKVLKENQSRLVAKLRDSTQKRLRSPEAAVALSFLQKEIARQRRHSPLRRTLRNAGAAIRAVKPCFLMSPLTVAQLLDGREPSFDLVIFDEASQLPAEDAVGAIARGRQLAVVGDPKQLPPTNFFAVLGGQVSSVVGEDGAPLFEDSESILEEFRGAGLPQTRLMWHYRSTHESLITFSNVSFYDAGLLTFPSTETDSHRQGLWFEHVPDAVYEGKGVNPVEARRVVDAVIEHARHSPQRSLGVGTFSLRQQQAILDELENRRRNEPGLEPFFAPRDEPFFVKNLENIQGDERDVIFLSVTYGPDREGRLRYNFGPINGENGWRRLNVLTTRAREHMRVFSSFRGDEINIAQTSSRGARLLREFLLYAERGRLDSLSGRISGEEETALERDVYRELTSRGLRLHPKVGLSGYRIDFGILDEAAPGRYLCGIECDGPMYLKAETARDRDRLRQEVLEARGWALLRLWSTDWFKDRRGQIERLLQAIAELRVKAAENSPDAVRGKEEEPALPTGPADPDIQLALPSLPLRMATDFRGERADQIPSSAYRDAVVALLRSGESLERRELINQVRSLLGFSRTGPRLQEAIGAAIDSLLTEGVIGHGSSGFRLRE